MLSWIALGTRGTAKGGREERQPQKQVYNWPEGLPLLHPPNPPRPLYQVGLEWWRCLQKLRATKLRAGLKSYI